MSQHITPPPQWQMDEWQARIETMGADVPSILLEVIQWGVHQANADIERKLKEAADRELEACLGEVSFLNSRALADRVRAARRPKPEILKEEALEELDGIARVFRMFHGGDLVCDKIRRALESIPDPFSEEL